jgi:hypothetical protein
MEESTDTSETMAQHEARGAAVAGMMMTEDETETTKWIEDEEAGEDNAIAKNLI